MKTSVRAGLSNDAVASDDDAAHVYAFALVDDGPPHDVSASTSATVPQRVWGAPR